MNLHTFKDVVNSKKQSLAHDLDEDEDEDAEVRAYKGNVEGEEEGGDERFNDAGEVIEPFNLRDERDSGHFDENMNFVFKKDKGEIDAWLADMDEAAMEQSIGEAAKALKLRHEKQEEADRIASNRTKRSEMELKMELLKIMNPGETVVQIMRRMSGKTAATKTNTGSAWGGKSNNQQKKVVVAAGSSAGSSSSSKEEARAQRAVVEQITDLVDELLSFGLTGVYEMTYEAIEASAVRWEYRGQDGALHGPYTSQEIAGWKAAGYFTGPTAVMMRKVGAVGMEWASASTSSALSKTIAAGGTDTDTRLGSSSASASASASSSEYAPVLGTRVRFDMGEPTGPTGRGDGNDNGNDPAQSEQPASKKQKVSSEGEGTGASASARDDAQDLMDDLEDEEEEGEKNGGEAGGGNGGVSMTTTTDSTGGGATASSASAASSAASSSVPSSASQPTVALSDLPRGPWISSDDVDFGSHDQRDRGDGGGDGEGEGGVNHGNDDEEEREVDDDEDEEEDA